MGERRLGVVSVAADLHVRVQVSVVRWLEPGPGGPAHVAAPIQHAVIDAAHLHAYHVVVGAAHRAHQRVRCHCQSSLWVRHRTRQQGDEAASGAAGGTLARVAGPTPPSVGKGLTNGAAGRACGRGHKKRTPRHVRGVLSLASHQHGNSTGQGVKGKNATRPVEHHKQYTSASSVAQSASNTPVTGSR